MVQRLLPSLAPDGMTIKLAPSFADFPLYNADIQNSTGFPAPVNTLADAIRAADGFQHSRRVEERNRLVSRLQNQPFAGKPTGIGTKGRSGACNHALAQAGRDHDFRRYLAFRVMDGIDLAREVKMRWPHLVVILTSGNAGERLEQLPPGVDYMPKPWQPLNVLPAAERAGSSARGNKSSVR